MITAVMGKFTVLVTLLFKEQIFCAYYWNYSCTYREIVQHEVRMWGRPLSEKAAVVKNYADPLLYTSVHSVAN